MIGAPRSATLGNSGLRNKVYPLVGLLLHCDGSNGGTSFVDSSRYGTSCTVTGGITTSTSSPKFGSASLLGTGSTGYVLAAYNASAVLGSSDFCWQSWVNPSAFVAGGSFLFSNYNSSTSMGVAVILNNLGEIRVYATTGGATWTIFQNLLVGSISTGVWTHVSFSRSGNIWYGSIGGVVVNLGTFSGSIGNPAVGYYIAGSPVGGSAYEISGKMDEIQLAIGTGTAITTNFTPPDRPFSNF